MEENTKTAEAQGAETKEKRQASKSQTVKSFFTVVKNLGETKLVNEKDLKTLQEIYNKVKKQYVGEDMF